MAWTAPLGSKTLLKDPVDPQGSAMDGYRVFLWVFIPASWRVDSVRTSNFPGRSRMNNLLKDHTWARALSGSCHTGTAGRRLRSRRIRPGAVPVQATKALVKLAWSE